MAIRLTLWDMESLVDVGIRRYFTHDSKCGQMGDCEDSPKRAYDCTGQCWMLCAAVVHRLVVEGCFSEPVDQSGFLISTNQQTKIRICFHFYSRASQRPWDDEWSLMQSYPRLR